MISQIIKDEHLKNNITNYKIPIIHEIEWVQYVEYDFIGEPLSFKNISTDRGCHMELDPPGKYYPKKRNK